MSNLSTRPRGMNIQENSIAKFAIRTQRETPAHLAYTQGYNPCSITRSIPSAVTLNFTPTSNHHVRSATNSLLGFLVAESHLLLDLGDRLTRVETLGAGSGAVENGVATVQAHRVLEVVLALGCALITRVGEPSVRLEQDGGSEVLLRVPPVRRARGRAAGAENALVKTVELAAVLLGLSVLTSLLTLSVHVNVNEEERGPYVLGRGLSLEVGLDALVLLVEVRQVGDEILDDVGVRKRVDLDIR